MSDTNHCPTCGAFVLEKHLPRHLRKVHSTPAERLEQKTALKAEQQMRRELKKKALREERRRLGELLVKCPICKISIKKKSLKGHKKAAHGIGLPLRLISQRGTRIHVPCMCNICNKTTSPTWHYKESTKGSVNVCLLCRPALLDKSFGKLDALDHAVSGGGFETSRRRF